MLLLSSLLIVKSVLKAGPTTSLSWWLNKRNLNKRIASISGCNLISIRSLEASLAPSLCCFASHRTASDAPLASSFMHDELLYHLLTDRNEKS